MDGQFLVRQIYDDEITYNLINAAVKLLSKFRGFIQLSSPSPFSHTSKFYSAYFSRYAGNGYP